MKTSDKVLSSRIPIAYVDVRVFAHATEDLERVLAAVRGILPVEQVDKVGFSKSGLTGHHGNPIVLVESRIKDKHVAQAILEKLASGLSMMDKELLGREVSGHLEKGNLYLRIDKQAAFQSVFKLSTSDPIHFRIHFKKHTSEEIVAICRKLGLFP